MSLYKHWSLVEEDDWHWPNFTPREIACRATGELRVVPFAMDRLQRLRELYGRILLTSAYRSRLHNVRVGGAALSAHRALAVGVLAFDISILGRDRELLYIKARQAGFTGFGFYNTFLHVDTGRRREWGSWT